MRCKICGHTSTAWKKGRILEEYIVQYYCCESCGFIQTEEPYWLDKAYSDAIAYNDIGLAKRNSTTALLTQAIILIFFKCNSRFIDYGGGYGLLVRLMRDRGLDFFLFDKFASNLFAQGFEARNDENEKFELLTAFEVFEHLNNPLDEIRQMLKFSNNILFTTNLVSTPPPALESWWYYSLESGQHVSFYTLKSLNVLAQKLNLRLYTNHRSVHLLTDKKISQKIFSFISIWQISQLVNISLRNKQMTQSLLKSDYFSLTGKKIN